MKIKKLKSYPHPVLSKNSDDILHSSLLSDITVSFDRSFYFFNYNCTVDNATVRALLENGRASLIIHVECSKTFYRKIFPITCKDVNNINGTLEISANELKDRTDLTVLICANTDIKDYAPENMHSDYEGMAFNIEKGDFIAVLDTASFLLHHQYDQLKNITSILSFHRDKNRSTGAIEVDFNGDRLLALLPADLHDEYEILKSDKRKEHIIVSILAVPVIMEGLRYIREGQLSQEEDVDKGLLWYRSIEKKLSDSNIKLCDEDNMFDIAQKLLENPCYRAAKAFQQIDDDE